MNDVAIAQTCILQKKTIDYWSKYIETNCTILFQSGTESSAIQDCNIDIFTLLIKVAQVRTHL